MLRKINAVLAALVLAGPAMATCTAMEQEDRSYTVCEVAAGDDLRLFLTDDAGATLGSFERVDEMLAGDGKRLAFAMNAGMYHADRRPVGLYVENGTETAHIVTSAGPGNFGLLPNGVFCIGQGFSVVESRRFAANPPACRFASQSGPMLVIDGALHPRFLQDSTSRYIRNGVGVSADGTRAVFAISDYPVTFHEFGRLFRDVLKTPNALYFDGKISRLYSPELGRSDFGFQMGPMVGLVVPAG
jgi:uncharacterized protein YigE (DUF2233 family)